MSNKNQGSHGGDRKENMKKWLVVLSIVNGVLAALTLVLVCLVLPRVEVDFDYLGFLVGVLGVLFAVVLGYNIYSIIDLRGLIEQNRQNAEEIENLRKKTGVTFVQLESELAAVYYNLSTGASASFLIRNSLIHNNTAVSVAAQDEAYSDCYEMIETIEDLYARGGQITKPDKDYLLNLLNEIPEQGKIANFYKLKGVVNSLTVVK